jgi:type VI protein secretion system component VasF
MTRLLRAAFLLGAILSLVAASGCGGDTKSSNDYVSELNKVQTEFADSVSKSTASAGSDPQGVFTSLGTNIDKLVGDLKSIEAPDKVKDLHNQLIDEMGRFKAEVKKAGDSLKSTDPAKIAEAQTEFATKASAIGTEIGKTITDINSKLQG